MQEYDIQLLRERLEVVGLGLSVITYRHADDHWDESVRGAGLLYVEKYSTISSTVVTVAWSVYIWEDGRILVADKMPAEARLVFDTWWQGQQQKKQQQ